MQHDNDIHYSPVIFTQGKFPVESVEYSEANDTKKETEVKLFKPVLSTASRDHCSQLNKKLYKTKGCTENTLILVPK